MSCHVHVKSEFFSLGLKAADNDVVANVDEFPAREPNSGFSRDVLNLYESFEV